MSPISVPLPALGLREYPIGLGRSLVKLVKDSNLLNQPAPCLRQKRQLDYENDLQLFRSLPMGDTWSDAQLADCYFYLWKNKHLHLPTSWKSTMVQFTNDLEQVLCHISDLDVFCLQLACPGVY